VRLGENIMNEEIKDVPATLEGLHSALFEEINAYRKSEVIPQHARTFAMLSKQVIQIYMVQLIASGKAEEMKRLQKVN
jgi:hypothetical protein